MPSTQLLTRMLLELSSSRMQFWNLRFPSQVEAVRCSKWNHLERLRLMGTVIHTAGGCITLITNNALHLLLHPVLRPIFSLFSTLTLKGHSFDSLAMS